MIYYMLLSMMLISGMIFMQMNHPLAMGLVLLIHTVLVSLTSGLMTSTFWFSYILFLIFLGGMLVLFIYVTSLASNEMFSLSLKLMMMSMFMFSITLLMYLMIDKQYMYIPMENFEMKFMSTMTQFTVENTLNLNKLYNFPTNMINMLLMNYLLITLIAVVKITNIFYGPLRKMN